MPILYEHTLR